MILETSKTLVLSTAHISENSMSLIENEGLPCSSWHGEFGGIVSVQGYNPSNSYFMERTPADVFNVVKFAHENGCGFVLFDRDGPEVEELPLFDW